MYETLFTELYRSHDKRTSVAAIEKVACVRWLPFDQKANNRGFIGVNPSTGQAVVELVTNGLDAVIIHHESLLDSTAIDVASSLQQIPGPHVDVYVQGGTKSNKKIVTALDRGCGMSGAKMKESVLALGSEDKPMNPRQHGSLGQGGATGFGISEGTLVASRLPGSDIITFTFVCERILDSGLPSYRYATDANGDLFTADAKKLALINPDSIPQTGVAQALASWKPVNEGGKGHEDMLFPSHGTIRRMLGVSIQYNAGSSKTSDGLWSGLRDYMFASEGNIRLFGDRAALENGKFVYKEKGVIRAGRTQLLAHGVGNRIAHKNSATLKFHESYTPMNVRFREEDGTVTYHPVDIEALAFSSYKQEIKGELLPATIVHNWLHASKSTEAPRGVMVTFNGQTHERLLSANVFDTHLPNLVGHVILHVRLDNLLPRLLHRAIVTTRDRLDPAFAAQLRHLLKDYVRNGPCAKELAKLNDELRPKATVINDGSLREALARATTLLSNTLNGISTGIIGTTGIMGAPFRKAVPPETPTRMGVVRTEGDDNEGGKPNPFDPLLDRPTVIQLRKNTFVRGAEEFVTIRINAKDHLDKNLQLLLPAGFEFVAGCRPLRNGSKTYRVRCAKGATDGIFTAVYDYGDETPCLVDRALVKVIKKREKTCQKVVPVVGTTPQVEMPKFQFLWVEGPNDPEGNYIKGFASSSTSADFFNYQLQDDTIYVYLNTRYPRYQTMLKMVEKYGPAVMADWKQRFPSALLLAAILQTDEKGGGLGPHGCVMSGDFQRLERIAMAQLMTILNVYDDAAMRQTIIAGHRHQEQAMAGD